MENIGELIRNRRKELGMTQSELSRRTGISREHLSKIEGGGENVTVNTLNLISTKGFGSSLSISFADDAPKFAKEKRHIMKMVKKNGGLWSYDLSKSAGDIDDEFIIENALRSLDLEQMHYLFEIYSREEVYRVWEHRLLSQGRRLSTMNLVLAVMVFKINNPLEFVNSYA